MAKEVTKTVIKEVTTHSPTKKGASKKEKKESIEQKVIENLVELQKVQTNLAEKFDKLTNQIIGLLNLFESAAKSFAENPIIQAGDKDRDFLDKVDKLLEQNKTIARGLMLIEERSRERIYGSGPSQVFQTIQQPPSIIEEQKSDILMPPRPTSPPASTPEDEFKPSLGGKPLPKF